MGNEQCTCPSGDGSLRWPCPAHPAEAQVVGGGDTTECGHSKYDPCHNCEPLDAPPAEAQGVGGVEALASRLGKEYGTQNGADPYWDFDRPSLLAFAAALSAQPRTIDSLAEEMVARFPLAAIVRALNGAAPDTEMMTVMFKSAVARLEAQVVGGGEAREGCVGTMTAERAAFFLERFKHDEKMLGPHEQWALDYTIAALSAQPRPYIDMHYGGPIPPPQPPSAPVGVGGEFAEVFKAVFDMANTPADKFADDAAWAHWLFRTAREAYPKAQRLRAALSAQPRQDDRCICEGVGWSNPQDHLPNCPHTAEVSTSSQPQPASAPVGVGVDGVRAAAEHLVAIGNREPEGELDRRIKCLRDALRASAQQPDSAPVGVEGLAAMQVPDAHTIDEDCNCEAVGYAKGWNAALAQQPAAVDGIPAVLREALAQALRKPPMTEERGAAIRRFQTLAGDYVHGLIDRITAPPSAPVGVEGECPVCSAPTDPDYGHVGDCLAQQPAAVDGAIPLDAHKVTLASLVAAVSLLRRGGRKAAPSDAMFNMMLADYEKAIEAGRIALAQQPAAVDEAIGRAFLAVLADPNTAWRDTGAKPFIDAVSVLAGQQPAAVDEADTRRLDYLIDNGLLAYRMKDTGLWMVVTGDGHPAVDGSEHDTPREAIDAAIEVRPSFAQPQGEG